MKRILYILLLLPSLSSYAQIGIGTSSPDNSAVLDVSANDKGILIPRVSLSNVNLSSLDGINPAANGLLIWNSNASVVGGNGIGFYFFNGTVWVKIDSNTNTLDQAYDHGGSGLGRTIVADTNPVRIEGTDGFLVTGTFGSGNSVEVSGTGTRAFFNPKKAAFRSGFVDGTQWDDLNIGNYSFAACRNSIASGTYSFAVNENTTASGQSASAFGVSTIASGQNSFALGNSTQAIGVNALASGNITVATGDNALSFGNNTQALSFSEVAIGSYNSLYTPSSVSAFNAADRAFVIGNGTGAGNRKDAFEVWKDGRVTINDSYTLPSVDGAANQILVTNGAGVVSWSGDTTSIVSNALCASNTSYVLSNTVVADIPYYETSFIPGLYNSLGNVQVKVIIRYTGTPVGTNQFRLRAHNGTTQTFPVTFADTWTTNTTQNGGVIQSQWKNWSAGIVPLELHLQGLTSSGGTMNVQSAYILIKSQ